jgi:hypothetical protein
MRRTVPLLTALAALAAALLATALPARADALLTVKFHADSGDACATPVGSSGVPYGQTDGSIAWQGRGGPGGYTWGQLTGSLTDRPVPWAAIDCRDDGRYSTATFIGWSGPSEVAVQQVKADNTTVSFAFALGGPTTTGAVQSIDRITIQVCRSFYPPGPYIYCGKQVSYPAPPLV